MHRLFDGVIVFDNLLVDEKTFGQLCQVEALRNTNGAHPSRMGVLVAKQDHHALWRVEYKN